MSAATREERTRILRMVAEGKVSPEEAEELIEAVEVVVRDETRVMSGPMPPPAGVMSGPLPPPAVAFGEGARRKLVIQVHEDGEQRVNVSIPMSLIRAARKLIPRQVQEHLDEHDIRLDELLEGLSHVDGDGILVQIQDDDTQVKIGIE